MSFVCLVVTYGCPKHLVDAGGPGCEHDEPVKAERNAACRRQSRERVQKLFIDGVALTVNALLLRHLLAQPQPLLGYVRELAAAVGKLHTTGVELKPLGDPPIAGARARQWRLHRGISVKNGRTFNAEIGFDPLHQYAAEDVPPAIVPREAYSSLGGSRGKRLRRLRRQHRREIDPGKAGKRLRDSQALGTCEGIDATLAEGELPASGNLRRKRKNCHAVFHQHLIGLVRAIPLDQSEFRMVQRPALAVAERARELEYAALARREQLLAGKFRRGAQIARSRARRRGDEIGREGVKMGFVARARPSATAVSTSMKSVRGEILPHGAGDARAAPAGTARGRRGRARLARHCAAPLSPAARLRKSLANGGRISMVRPDIRSVPQPSRPLHNRGTPAVKVIASSLRKGNIVELDGKLYVVLNAESFHPGKGTPTTQVDMRRISDGVKIAQRYKTTEQVERAYVEDREHQYLYQDGDGFHFMNTENYDQVTLPADIVGDQAAYLQPEMKVTLSRARGRPVSIAAAAEGDARSRGDRAHVKGQTAASSYKPAVLPTACAPWCRRSSAPAPRSWS